MHKKLNKITFDKIISNDTVYSVVWGGKYDNKQCVIKMVVLTSGKIRSKYFDKDDNKPFYHSEFKDKKPMNVSEFKHEVSSYKTFSNLKMGPELYDYWIHKDFKIHYGIIVMERLDGSLKQILIKRDLNQHEHTLVNQLIDTLHNKHEIVHGDMKPSNIGVYLNSKGEIKKCLFFDCQKVKYKRHYEQFTFHKLIERDNSVYRDHSINNRNLRRAKHH